MKTIIAGSRGFHDFDLLCSILNPIFALDPPNEIVSGTAAGADKLGEQYAAEHGIPIRRFPADWGAHGKAAGLIRNVDMANYADMLVAFWDGNSQGTKHMIGVSTGKGLKVKVFRYKDMQKGKEGHAVEDREVTKVIRQPNQLTQGGVTMSIFKPSSAVEGGGLLDDVDVTIKEARVEMWDYNGKVAIPVPALKLTLGLEEGDDQIQYFSLGKATDWQPNEDGTSLVQVGKATGLVKSSNAMIFIGSMVNAGFPEDKITEDVRCFEGLKAHLVRVPAPKRGGVTKAPREDGRVFEDTVLTVATILSLPWDKKAAKPAAGKPATGKPATVGAVKPAAAAASKPAAAGGDDIDAITTSVMQEILAENPEGILKKNIPGAAFKLDSVKGSPLKNKIITRIFQEDFISGGGDGSWVYEDGMVKFPS